MAGIPAGAVVGLAAGDHRWALQRDDVLALPLVEEEHRTHARAARAQAFRYGRADAALPCTREHSDAITPDGIGKRMGGFMKSRLSSVF